MKTNKQTHFRQGDVLIEEVTQIPTRSLVRQPANRPIVLAHGEATGHAHTLETKDPADWWKVDDQDSEQFVETYSTATVTHQEHETIKLPPGRYRITRQREYSPEAIRNVAD